MENIDFINYLIDFRFNVVLPVYPWKENLESTPIYNPSKDKWEFDETVKTHDYGITKNYIGSQDEFRIPSVFQTIRSDNRQAYYEYLKNKLTEFDSELQKKKFALSEEEYIKLVENSILILETSKKRIETRKICYNPEKQNDNYSKDHLYHRDVKLKYLNNFKNENPIERGLLNYIIAELVLDQIQVINYTIEFLNSEIKESSNSMTSEIKDTESIEKIDMEDTDSNDTGEKKYKRIRFRQNVNILGTLFYDLLEKNYIDTSKTNIARFLNETFTDEKGEAIKKSTIDTILKPEREDKRANENDRIKVPDL